MSTNISKKLAGKVAVVTGASKGIGAAIAKYLAAEGAAVVVNYASSKTGADKVVAEITGAGGKAVAVQGDVSKKTDIGRLFSESKKAFGHVDILVNNAGIRSLESTVQGFEERVGRLESDIKDSQKRATELEAKVGSPFEKEERYHKLVTRQSEIEEQLDLTKNQAPSQIETPDTGENDVEIGLPKIVEKAEKPARRVRIKV